MKTFNLLGDIVQDDSAKWFESDVVPAMVIGWLAKQEGDVEININSLGGSVTGGLAIANAIKGYSKGKVTANVLGIAASMASVVACAADEIRLGKGAFMMVHNPWTVAIGDANDLRKEAETLDQIKASIIAFYQSKFDCGPERLSEIMDAETWIADTDAEAYGLKCTTLAAEDDVFGKLAAKCDTRMMFAKAPAAAAAFYAHKDAGKTIEQDWESRYKGLSKRFNEAGVAHQAALAERDRAHAEAMEAAKQAGEAALAERDATHQKAIEEMAAAHKAEMDDLRASMEKQISTVRGDLEKAKADLSSAVGRAEKAEKDLADKGEQLDRLTKAHALLTGGVLTPGDGNSAEAEYRSELDAAKSAEQREEIRRKHYAKAKTTKKTK